MSLHFGDDVGKKKDKPIDDDVKGLDDDIEVDAAQRKKVLGFDEDDIDVKEEKADFHEAIKLSDALNGLVGKSLYSDCTFVVGKHGKEIHGHRVVLAASSRVFEAMLYPNSDFLADPSENREKLSKIVIPDVEPEVFLTLLRGIYTDKPELTEETVGGVIKAAKTYQLEKVQLACSLYLEDGVTKENALGLFNRAEELTGDPNLAMSFIEKWAGKLIEQPAFSALKKSRLEYLLKSDQLAVKEVELFKAVLRWGQAECKRQDLPNTTENVRKVLEDVIALIRFPTMNVIDLATQITPSQVLTQSETLELYQYLGAKDPSTGKSPMPTKFPTKGRVGGLVHDFVFDESRRGTNCALRENGRIVSGTAESYACVLGNKPLPTDHKTYWELRIVSNSQTGGSWRIAIGIATAALNLNSYLSEGPHGWAYFNQGCRCHQDGSGSNLYGGQYTTGAVIGVLFDPEKSTVSYYRDGKNLGPCWTNIPVKAQPLFPAVHVNAGVVVELIAPELTNVPQDEQ